MDDDSNVRVPIKVRTHEVNQLHEMLPEVVDRLAAIEHPDAEDFEEMYEEYVSDVEITYPGAPQDESFAAWVSMPADEWRLLIRHAQKYEDARAEWLQKKLMRRLSDRLEEVQ